jgi:hypothetical protein
MFAMLSRMGRIDQGALSPEDARDILEADWRPTIADPENSVVDT